MDPAPILEIEGLMFNTMEHQLAKWTMTNKVIELALSGSIHTEIVIRSIPLIKLMVLMCTSRRAGDDITSQSALVGRNAYCIEPSHLEMMWMLCISKHDAAMTAKLSRLLAQADRCAAPGDPQVPGS